MDEFVAKFALSTVRKSDLVQESGRHIANVGLNGIPGPNRGTDAKAYFPLKTKKKC